jgi:hypothetical protein
VLWAGAWIVKGVSGYTPDFLLPTASFSDLKASKNDQIRKIVIFRFPG